VVVQNLSKVTSNRLRNWDKNASYKVQKGGCAGGGIDKKRHVVHTIKSYFRI